MYLVINYSIFLEKLKIQEALVAQSVERQAVNLQVDCSNQSWGEFFFIKKKISNMKIIFFYSLIIFYVKQYIFSGINLIIFFKGKRDFDKIFLLFL